MASTKIDLGAVANKGIDVLFGWLNKTIGAGNSPLVKQESGNVKVGNVGGIFGINLNITTIILLAAGVVGLVLIIKKK
jgi:hypothetical protein